MVVSNCLNIDQHSKIIINFVCLLYFGPFIMKPLSIFNKINYLTKTTTTTKISDFNLKQNKKK